MKCFSCDNEADHNQLDCFDCMKKFVEECRYLEMEETKEYRAWRIKAETAVDRSYELNR